MSALGEVGERGRRDHRVGGDYEGGLVIAPGEEVLSVGEGLRTAVQAARRVECTRTNGASLEGTRWAGQPCDQAFPILQRDDAEVESVRTVMHCWLEATAAFQQAAHLQPDLKEAHYGLGMCYGQLGYFGQAIEAFQQAMQITPEAAEREWRPRV